MYGLEVAVPTNNPVLVCCQGLASFAIPPCAGLESRISTLAEFPKAVRNASVTPEWPRRGVPQLAPARRAEVVQFASACHPSTEFEDVLQTAIATKVSVHLAFENLALRQQLAASKLSVNRPI
ncbi:hypothetical protein ACFL5Q_03590 [Planctomycetota bacterium]